MKTTWYQKLILGLAGLAALVIGLMITFAPHTFYASYGLSLGESPDLLSELRAPGANLAALGVIILVGVFRAGFAPVSALIAQTLFLAYAFGRTVSVMMDGMPSDGIFQALIIELVIGGLCLALFYRRPGVTRPADSPARRCRKPRQA
ncbi:MAG: DUF4345 domain-containing protein [Alphaproteobacteria bacterium]|nr:DUF4345 domain-containing protein [Alphaproteobacteria bacterium]